MKCIIIFILLSLTTINSNAIDEDTLQESLRRAFNNLRDTISKDHHDAHVDTVKVDDEDEEEDTNKSIEDITTTTTTTTIKTPVKKLPETRRSLSKFKNISGRRTFGPISAGLKRGLTQFIPAIQRMLENLLALVRGTPIYGFIQFIVNIFTSFFGRINDFPQVNFFDGIPGLQAKKIPGIPNNIPQSMAKNPLNKP